MIEFPPEWMRVGKPVTEQELEDALLDVLSCIDCSSLAFSGGLDSSLILYYLTQLHNRVFAYTVGTEGHPDVVFASLVASEFSNVTHRIYLPSDEEIEVEARPMDYKGDAAVRLFYKFVAAYTDRIIACDGIDELMAGYYAHQNDPSEAMYYTILRKLQAEQLQPLHENSGAVRVLLPYLDHKFVFLASQIPLFEKVDGTCRKKILAALAKDKVPEAIIERRKIGFCDALKVFKEG